MIKSYLLLTITSFLFLTISLHPSERADASPLVITPDPFAPEMIMEVNALRASRNLPPYQTNAILMSIAQSHAEFISSTGVSTHFSADGSHPYQRAIAAGYSVAGELSQGGLFSENIGSGKNLTIKAVVDIWQSDPSDLEALLSSDLKDIGVGVKNKNGITYYVLDAGASLNDPIVFTSTPIDGARTPGIPAPSTPLDDGAVYHMVQANEALWSIALAYETTIDQLKLLNGLSTNDIFEGQKLLIKKPEVLTATPEKIITATLGIPTSTATRPVTPILTNTATPLPTPPTSRETGGMALGTIVFIALLAAGIGSWLGRRGKSLD